MVFFEEMVSFPNLFSAWDQFKKGKAKSKDIPYFHRFLEDHIFALHEDLMRGTYRHGSYQKFSVLDPKKREISKASVRDRLVHHLVYSHLVKIFDPLFIAHSFSCRLGKGTHQGVKTLKKLSRKVSRNGTRPCFALKMDVLRFFDHVHHPLLKTLLERRIKDPQILALIFHIIDSFVYHKSGSDPLGLPLGNVTSQIFANIYLHELDLFVKHELKKPYLRFCDDCVLLSTNREQLKKDQLAIEHFLKTKLFLTVHPKKVTLRKLDQGIDFLGYVVFLNHTILRTKTKKRLKKKLERDFSKFLNDEIESGTMDQKLQSYLGILSHANECTLSTALKNSYPVRISGIES